jgi:hypothetical protein
MVKYLGRRLFDGLVSLGVIILVFEGPTILAIARDKLRKE